MAKLKIDIRESIELNNNKYDSFNTYTVDAINEIDKRITTVPTSEQEIAWISGSIGRGAFITTDVRYMRFTNVGNGADPQAYINLTFRNTNDAEFAVKIPNGGSFMYQGISGSGVTGTLAASGSALSGSQLFITGSTTTDDVFGSLYTITAKSSGSACDIEYFIASN